MTLRLLAVHAHPDDESSKGAATYAYYRARGVRVMVVSCTGGGRGDVLNPALADRAAAERDMAGFRRGEMERAQAVLDVEHAWLGYQDSGMPGPGEPLPPNCFAAIPVAVAAAPLVRIVRRFRPQVMVTYDENGGYPHPDHIRTHEVAVAAFEAAAEAGRYPDAGAPWRVDKLYYDRMFSQPRAQAVLTELRRRDPAHPLLPDLERIAEWVGRPVREVTTQVPCGEFFEVRDAALRSHASQVPPDSPFFFWPNEVQRAAWPYEDFELARSFVTTALPETDLFAGVTDREDLDDAD